MNYIQDLLINIRSTLYQKYKHRSLYASLFVFLVQGGSDIDAQHVADYNTSLGPSMICICICFCILGYGLDLILMQTIKRTATSSYANADLQAKFFDALLPNYALAYLRCKGHLKYSISKYNGED